MKKRLYYAMILFIGVILVGAGCSAGDKQFSPEEVLNNVLEEPGSPVSYYAEAEVRIYENETLMNQIILKEWVGEDGKKRVETELDDEQSITVHNGEKIISYVPEKNEAMIIEDPELLSGNQMSPKEQAEHMLQMVKDTHDINIVGEEEIIGRDTYHIEALAKESDALIGDQELWIDKENWMVLKMIFTSANIKTELEYTQIDFEAEISSETFTLELPQDVHILDLEDFFESSESTLDEAAERLNHAFLYFPEEDGVSIVEVELVELKGEINRPEVNINYEKDGAPLLTLTVFPAAEEGEEDQLLPGEEKITVRNTEGTYMEMGAFRSLVWQEEGFNYTLLPFDPELNLEVLLELTETMVPVE